MVITKAQEIIKRQIIRNSSHEKKSASDRGVGKRVGGAHGGRRRGRQGLKITKEMGHASEFVDGVVMKR